MDKNIRKNKEKILGPKVIHSEKIKKGLQYYTIPPAFLRQIDFDKYFEEIDRKLLGEK